MESKFELIYQYFKKYDFGSNFKISKIDLREFLKREGIYEDFEISEIQDLVKKKRLFSSSEFITEFKITNLRRGLEIFKKQFIYSNETKIEKQQNEVISFLELKDINEIIKEHKEEGINKITKKLDLEKVEENQNKVNSCKKEYLNLDFFDLEIENSIFELSINDNKNKEKQRFKLRSKYSSFFMNENKTKSKKIKINIENILFVENEKELIKFIFNKLFELFSVININEILYIIRNNDEIITYDEEIYEIKERLEKLLTNEGCDLTSYPLYLEGIMLNDYFEEIELTEDLLVYMPDWVINQRMYWNPVKRGKKYDS